MNVKRFTARTSRDALMLVRQAFGDDAVVVSTRPCADGVEVLAMAPESVQQFERVATPAHPPALAARAPARPAPRTQPTPAARPAPSEHETVEQDVAQLGMSTLSFQDYVRERVLKRRQAELESQVEVPAPARRPEAATQPARAPAAAAAPASPPAEHAVRAPQAAVRLDSAPLADPDFDLPPMLAQPVAQAMAGRMEATDMMNELRSMRGLIEQRFGALAFMEKLQRQPRQAQLSQKLLDIGFSPQLVRKMVESLPADGDETEWAAGVLERNLDTGERGPALEDQGGVYALIGSTGVGKTTSTAKLAAAFATKHGAANLGLVTLDAYRVAAHEQLRTYGRILGVPVHTAHDRASLEDLLDLLSAKKMVLIDTAGMAQRDTRTRELLEMLSHRSVNRLLVVNAAAQGETIEDVLVSYRAASCKGVILSKIDEAVKLGPAMDAVIRHRLKVVAVANGQRVPEDWHRLSAHALVQRALRGGGSPAWRMDAGEVNLVFAGMPGAVATKPSAGLAV
ncbi:MAG: flagellar biosynthesis protein FlhF [Rubrivivax sp.]|nr:flagellar biosynthesis protein FlhF [Rubrivivax sp.]MDH5339553.1 flagellar biosynthesis protein FlhF [Rubrivivax sp.]